MKKTAFYVVPVLLCLIAGFAASELQREALAEWYPLLVKPALTPPNIAFPIAWGIIYICMGISLGRVLQSGDRSCVTLWFLQLAVNFLWSVFFFYLRSPLAGLVDIVVLDLLVIVYIVRVRRRSASAAWLFAPYFVWIFFATYLNASIYVANSGAGAPMRTALAPAAEAPRGGSAACDAAGLFAQETGCEPFV